MLIALTPKKNKKAMKSMFGGNFINQEPKRAT